MRPLYAPRNLRRTREAPVEPPPAEPSRARDANPTRTHPDGNPRDRSFYEILD